jgi:DNA-binding beta-propeller fold protein YncE
MFGLMALAAFSTQAEAETIEFVSMFGEFGQQAGQFNLPTAIDVDNQGRIFIAERNNRRFQICDYDGDCSIFGKPGSGKGEFGDPQGIEVDSQGRVLIAEGETGSRVQILDQQGNWIAWVGGTPATGMGQFATPAGLTVDGGGRIIISELDPDRVNICSYEGDCSVFGGSGSSVGLFNFPRGVAVDRQGRIVVADWGNHRIQVCDDQGDCFAFGSFGNEAGQFNNPAGVAIDNQGRIVVADRDNNRLQLCNIQGECEVYGGAGTGPGEFNKPLGVVVDSNDRIVVSERDNHRVQILRITDSGMNDFQIDAGLNGNWWNGLDRNGEGVQIEVADGGDGSLTFVATIYSYGTMDNQIFLIAVGTVNGNIVEVDVFITDGGLWGSDLDPALVTETQWGTGIFTASSCDAIHMSLMPNEQFKSMGFTDLAYGLMRLTTTLIPCPIENPG